MDEEKEFTLTEKMEKEFTNGKGTEEEESKESSEEN